MSRVYPISAWANVLILGNGSQYVQNRAQQEPTTQQSNKDFGTGPLFEAICVSQERTDTFEDSIEMAILECLG